VYIDEDSVLGSQVPQELGNEAAHGSDDEDMQDLSHPLDGAVNWDTADDFQRGNSNRKENVLAHPWSFSIHLYTI